MMIYAHLALAYLKKQRGRTIALISGVALAVMFVFGYNVISESQSRNQISNIHKIYGTYHGIFHDLSNKSHIGKIKNDKDIAKSAVSINLGNAITDNGIAMGLNSSDKDYIEMSNYKHIKGHLPNKQGEVALESKVLKEMGLEENLGETINLKIKKEYKDKNGINQIYMDTKPFKIVGIIDKLGIGNRETNYTAPVLLKGFTYFEEGEKNVLPDNLITYDEIVKLKSSTNTEQTFNQIEARYNLNSQLEINNNLILALTDFEHQKQNGFKDQFTILVIITAVLLIYNMFNISLIDKIKEIGMLKAVGASKKHVRLIMGVQSLFILITGLVFGLLMGVIFSYFGIKLISFTPSIVDVSESSVYISMRNIWNAVIIGTITVIVSSIIPIWMSGRISPIEAIKKSDKSGRQRTRTYHKAIKKLFGITGEMAYKNMWRNKGKTLIIVVAVAMAGYIFIDYIAFYNNQNTFSNKVDPKLLSMQDNDFRLSFGINTDPDFTGYTKKDLKTISNIKGVNQVGTRVSMDGFLETDIKDLQEEFKKENGISHTNKKVETPLVLKGYDDNQLQKFQKYIEKGNISSLNTVFVSDEYLNAVIFNYNYSNQKEIRKNLNVGDIITIKIPVVNDDKVTYREVNVRVSALLKPEWELKGDSSKMGYMEIILPQKNLMSISEENTYDQVSLQVDSGREIYVNKEINKVLADKPFVEIESKLGFKEKDMEGLLSMIKSNMVIVVLILLIAAMNVYNTIKANLLIRTNEFSTLRAIGMTVKQLKNMIIKESIFYGILGSIIAALMGSYKVYSLYSLVNRQYKGAFNINKTIQFTVPIIPILLYSAIVIAICILSAYISARRVEKLNIVEGLNITE